MPFSKNDPNINREGRPVGSTKPKWNDLQTLLDITIEEWDKLTPLQKVEWGQKQFQMVIDKVPQVHLTQQESVLNALARLGETELDDKPPASSPANGHGENSAVGSGSPGLPPPLDSKGLKA